MLRRNAAGMAESPSAAPPKPMMGFAGVAQHKAAHAGVKMTKPKNHRRSSLLTGFGTPEMNKIAMDLEHTKKQKFKEFRRGYDHAGELVDSSHPDVKKKVHVYYQVGMLGIASILVAVGITLLAMSTSELRRNARASQATCKIQDFTTPVGVPVDPLATWETQCSMCAFFVQGKTEDDSNSFFSVKGWKPAFSPNYRSQHTAQMEDDAFKCCPTEPSLNCCKFYHVETGLFCDNWGEYVDPKCPVNPWPCYVLDLEKKMAKGENLSPDDLHVGEAQGSYPLLICGAILTPIGALMLLCVAPCCHAFWHIRCIKRRTDWWRVRCARCVPRLCRTEKLHRTVVEDKAAKIIQRFVRNRKGRRNNHHNHHGAAPLSDGLAAVLKDPPAKHSGENHGDHVHHKFGENHHHHDHHHHEDHGYGIEGMIPFTVPSEPSKGSEAEPDLMDSRTASKRASVQALNAASGHEGPLEFHLLTVAEKAVAVRKMKKRVREAEQDPQIGRGAHLIDPLAGKVGGKRLVYDSGSAASFKNMAHHRIVSTMWDKVERVEVGISEAAEAEELVEFLHPPTHDDVLPSGVADDRWIVGQIRKGSIVEMMNLAPGLRLQKVGKMQFPQANGQQMIENLLEGHKPIFLYFEGRPRDFHNPAFAEDSRNYTARPRKKSVCEDLHVEHPLPPGSLPDLQPLMLPPTAEPPPPPPQDEPPMVPFCEGAEELSQAASDVVCRVQVRRSRQNSTVSSSGHQRRSRPASSTGPTRRGSSDFCSTPAHERSVSFPLEAGGREKVQVGVHRPASASFNSLPSKASRIFSAGANRAVKPTPPRTPPTPGTLGGRAFISKSASSSSLKRSVTPPEIM